jgi:hypothetical protein
VTREFQTLTDGANVYIQSVYPLYDPKLVRHERIRDQGPQSRLSASQGRRVQESSENHTRPRRKSESIQSPDASHRLSSIRGSLRSSIRSSFRSSVSGSAKRSTWTSFLGSEHAEDTETKVGQDEKKKLEGWPDPRCIPDEDIEDDTSLPALLAQYNNDTILQQARNLHLVSTGERQFLDLKMLEAEQDVVQEVSNSPSLSPLCCLLIRDATVRLP